MTTSTQTTRLADTQLADAGPMLARAFHDDPLMGWWLPDEEHRRKALPWFMGTATKYGHKHGEVETTAGAVEGGAVWLTPGKTHIPVMQMLVVGLWQAPLKLGPANFVRFMSTLDFMEKLHQEAVPEDHWYLMILGVDPPRQGQGVGSALMQPVLARADAAHQPCYLETNKEINVTLYQKHGFEVVVEDELPKGGPRYWTMRRAAR